MGSITDVLQRFKQNWTTELSEEAIAGGQRGQVHFTAYMDLSRMAFEGNRTAKFIDIDTNGQLSASDQNVRLFQWDHRNRLISSAYYASGSDALSDTDATDRIEYVYDPFNQLIGREFDPDGDTVSAQVEQTFFIYEQGQIALQFDKTGDGNVAAGDLSHRYLWGPAVDMVLADEEVDNPSTAGDTHWALTDHLGSVRDLVDDSGNLENHKAYDAFGNVVIETTPADDILFGYTGKLYDDVLELQNNWNRWYDPATGSWTSEDPIGFEAGDANKFRYVGNMATGYVDPNGLDAEQPEWWNDSGWDWANLGAYPGLRHAINYSTGYYDAVDRSEELDARRAANDSCKTLQAGDIGTVRGGSQLNGAASAETQINQFGRDVVADIAIEAGTGGLGGIFGRADDVADLARAARRARRGAQGILAGGRGFRSFRALKRFLGSAGEGRAWHHIVEQSKLGQFGCDAIHNTNNVVSLPTDLHRRITAFYQSKPGFTNGLRVRDWLAGQSFEEQWRFGMQVFEDLSR